jgi:AcrR family transcriptional regulator
MSAPRPAVRMKTKTLQRLLETAADLFLEQGFDNVSVAAIAKAAHCSTATVYDIYGNKEGLFAEAISLALTPTLIEWNAETSGFLALLQYTHERIIELSTVRVRRLVRAVTDWSSCLTNEDILLANNSVTGVLISISMFRPELLR